MYPFTHIFSSDLQRARQTAEAIANRATCRFSCSLLSVKSPSGAGKDWIGTKSWRRIRPTRNGGWITIRPSLLPEERILSDFRKRIRDAMDAIADQVQGGCAVVVTHAGVIRTFCGELARHGTVPAEFPSAITPRCWKIWRDDRQWSTLQEITSRERYVK